MPTRSCPCRRATSSMRYVRPCGTGVLECRSNNACSSLAVRPVSRARRIDGLADAVHHRRARRLHGGDRRQLLGKLAFQRSGHDRPSGRPAAGSGRWARAAPCPSRRRRRRLGAGQQLRAGVVIAPRPTTTQRVRLGQQVADRARVAAAPPSGADARSSPATPRWRRRPLRRAGRRARPAATAGPAAPRWRTANPTAPHRVCRRVRGCRSGSACPAGPATSTPAGATCDAAGDSTNRSAATVGAQYGPAPSCGFGFGHARRDQPRRRRRPRGSGRAAASSMPVTLVSRLTSRTPRPPLRSSGTGVAPRVSSTSSTSRSRSIDRARGHGVDVGDRRRRHRRIGLGQLRPVLAARRASPGRPAAAGSRFRRRPGAAGPRPAAAAPAGPAGCRARRRGCGPSASPRAAAAAARAAARRCASSRAAMSAGLLGVLERWPDPDTRAGPPRPRRPRALRRRPTPARAHAGRRRPR